MNRDGPKGYTPSSIFSAFLLMYLLSMESVLNLIRFLKTHQDWLVRLNLRKMVDGAMTYKIPDRTTFYKFAERLGPEKIVEIFAVMVARLMQMESSRARRCPSTPRSSGRGSRTVNRPTNPTTTTGGAGATEGETGTHHGPGIITGRCTCLDTRST
jgi:hypothetical protein